MENQALQPVELAALVYEARNVRYNRPYEFQLEFRRISLNSLTDLAYLRV
jgi:hypothetical protein